MGSGYSCCVKGNIIGSGPVRSGPVIQVLLKMALWVPVILVVLKVALWVPVINAMFEVWVWHCGFRFSLMLEVWHPDIG